MTSFLPQGGSVAGAEYIDVELPNSKRKILTKCPIILLRKENIIHKLRRKGRNI